MVASPTFLAVLSGDGVAVMRPYRRRLGGPAPGVEGWRTGFGVTGGSGRCCDTSRPDEAAPLSRGRGAAREFTGEVQEVLRAEIPGEHVSGRVGAQERVSVGKCAGFRRLVGSAPTRSVPRCSRVRESQRSMVPGPQGEDVCPSADHPRP
jgi:hypothetical protein